MRPYNKIIINFERSNFAFSGLTHGNFGLLSVILYATFGLYVQSDPRAFRFIVSDLCTLRSVFTFSPTHGHFGLLSVTYVLRLVFTFSPTHGHFSLLSVTYVRYVRSLRSVRRTGISVYCQWPVYATFGLYVQSDARAFQFIVSDLCTLRSVFTFGPTHGKFSLMSVILYATFGLYVQSDTRAFRFIVSDLCTLHSVFTFSPTHGHFGLLSVTCVRYVRSLRSVRRTGISVYCQWPMYVTFGLYVQQLDARAFLFIVSDLCTLRSVFTFSSLTHGHFGLLSVTYVRYVRSLRSVRRTGISVYCQWPMYATFGLYVQSDARAFRFIVSDLVRYVRSLRSVRRTGISVYCQWPMYATFGLYV